MVSCIKLKKVNKCVKVTIDITTHFLRLFSSQKIEETEMEVKANIYFASFMAHVRECRQQCSL